MVTLSADSSEPIDPLDVVQSGSFWALARRHELDGVVAHRLRNAGIAVPSNVWEAHQLTCGRIGRLMTEMDRMAVVLAREDIPLVALKNAGIARGLYPCPGCCPMGDLDLLVERRHLRAAHELLVRRGYTLKVRGPLQIDGIASAEESGGAEYVRVREGETTWVEVQWRPVAGRWIRADQEPNGSALLRRSLSIQGSPARRLAPSDNLLQVALHTAKHSYIRAPGLRLHLDVDRIVRRQHVDWDTFVHHVLTLQVRTAAYFSLAIPAALFGTPIPAGVLKAVSPPAWKRVVLGGWIRRAGLLEPEDRKFNRVEYLLFGAALYDDLGGLARAVIPSRSQMEGQGRSLNGPQLGAQYVSRLLSLVRYRNTT